MEEKVQILMSTYNGERYLTEQLYSLLNQEDVHVDILIRDDGSTDHTVNIIRDFMQHYSNIHVYSGDNLGFAKSFWNLVSNAGNAEYYAFCDQDDIWLPDKIKCGITALKKCDNHQPLLYTSNVICVNQDNELLDMHPFQGEVLDIYSAFQKSILPGCTFIFNQSSLNLYKLYQGPLYAHDWAAYIITTAFGKVIYDSNGHIHYRLHGDNAIGAKTSLQFIKEKLRNLVEKNDCIRSRFANAFYDTYYNRIDDHLLKRNIYDLGHYQLDKKAKARLLFRDNFHGIVFKTYVVINKV